MSQKKVGRIAPEDYGAYEHTMAGVELLHRLDRALAEQLCHPRSRHRARQARRDRTHLDVLAEDGHLDRRGEGRRGQHRQDAQREQSHPDPHTPCTEARGGMPSLPSHLRGRGRTPFLLRG